MDDCGFVVIRVIRGQKNTELRPMSKIPLGIVDGPLGICRTTYEDGSDFSIYSITH